MLVFFSFRPDESPQKKRKTEYSIEEERYLVNLIFYLPLHLLEKRMEYLLDKNYTIPEIKKFFEMNGQTKKQTNELKEGMCKSKFIYFKN